MKTEFGDAPILSALLDHAGIKFVDIGGRGSAFAALAGLARYADYYVSEPDDAEAVRLREILPADSPWRSVTVFTEAIASRHGEANLHMTQQPGMSSLLEPNPEVADRFYLSHKFAVESIARVPTIPLDAAADHYGFTDACFIKLDTQGTELDIMQSGAHLVAGPLLGVHTESNLQPFYKGQSLFADLDSYLRANGFSLFSLNRTALRRTGYRPELYSKRIVTWAHCLYLREPATLLLRGAESAARDLPRLLALTLAFQFYDVAFEIVELCHRIGLCPATEIERLTSEVEMVAVLGTRRILLKAENAGSGNLKGMLLSPNLRDKKRLE